MSTTAPAAIVGTIRAVAFRATRSGAVATRNRLARSSAIRHAVSFHITTVGGTVERPFVVVSRPIPGVRLSQPRCPR